MKKIFSFLLIGSSLSYLISEFIVINNSKDLYRTYIKYTITDLCSFKVGGHNQLFNNVLIINGIIFFICYLFLSKYIIKNPRRILLIILSFLVMIGSILVGLFHNGLVHIIGTILVFLIGNIFILLHGIFLDNSYLKITSYTLSIIGLLSGILIVILKNYNYYPILERLSVYPIVFYEAIISIYVLIKPINNYPFVY